LVRNQDIEFNLRLRRAGGKIVLDPAITTFYCARSRLRDIAANSFQNGFWVVRAARVARAPFSTRHIVPLGFVAGLLASGIASTMWSPALLGLLVLAGSYLGANLCFACRAAAKHGAALLAPLLAVFPTLHLSYGFGSLLALLTIWWPETGGSQRARAQAQRAACGVRNMERGMRKTET
jgi:hypothetical protein